MKPSAVLLLSGMASSVIAYTFPDPCTEAGYAQYSALMALAYTLVMWSVERKIKEKDLYWHLTLFVLGCCVSNLMDEIIFDPLVTGWNEYAGAGLAFVVTITLYLKPKWAKKSQKHLHSSTR